MASDRMANSVEDTSNKWLLPRNWHTAPKQYWNVDRAGMFYFCTLNFIFGTLGLWAPILLALMSGKSVWDVFVGMLGEGNGYLYVIPFIASIVFAVIETRRAFKESGANVRLDVLTVVAFFACLVCVLLFTCQFLVGDKVPILNYVVQLIACTFITVVGLYMFCLIKAEMKTSVGDDIAQGADQMRKEAQDAKLDKRDFQ